MEKKAKVEDNNRLRRTKILPGGGTAKPPGKTTDLKKTKRLGFLRRRVSDEILEDEKKYLLEWAWNLHKKGLEVELIDGRLSEYNVEEVRRVIGVALLCTQASHSLRPPMSRVVAMLSGDVEVSDVTSKAGYLADWRFDDITRYVEVNDDTSKLGYITDIATCSQAKETGFKISPGKTESQPILGSKISFGRKQYLSDSHSDVCISS